SRRPAPSTSVFQYIASSGVLIGPGNILVCAARVNMLLVGRPHPNAVTQPLILVRFTFARISTVTTANPNPTKKPWISAFRSVSASAARTRLMTTKPQTAPTRVTNSAYVRPVIVVNSTAQDCRWTPVSSDGRGERPA